jgi:hypothetical protein
MIGGLFIASGSCTTSLFGSWNGAPKVLDVTMNLPLSPTADSNTIVCPQVASVVVVMQSETCTGAPPVEKFADVALPQVAPAEKAAVTAA